MSREKGNSAGRSGGEEPRRFKVRHVFFCAFALMLVLAIISYAPGDMDALGGGTDALPENWIGNLGAHLAYALFICCGFAAYLFLGLLLLGMFRSFLPERGHRLRFLGGSALMMLGAMLLFAIAPETFAELTDRFGLGRAETPQQALPGGVIGQFFAAPQVENPPLPEGWLRRLIGPIGTMVTGWTLLLGGMVMIYLADFHRLVAAQLARREEGVDEEAPRSRVEALAAAMGRDEKAASVPAPQPAPPVVAAPAPASEAEPPRRGGGLLGGARAALEALKRSHAAEDTAPEAVSAPFVPEREETPELPEIPEMPSPRSVVSATEGGKRNSADPDTRIVEEGKRGRVSLFGNYTLPPITMLSKGAEATGENIESIVRCREILQRTLDNFKVDGTVVNHISGPRVTRYEIQLAPGVKVEKVVNLESNIAMELEAQSVRILAPIPGRNVVGVEAPNSRAEAVFMRSVMESKQWQETSAEIPIVLGRDVAGKPVILDLAKAPHLLIAGATGSGKSVCMNTLIMSLLFRFRPDELRLILVDPKVVEHEAYRTLPHLITPVVNDPRKVPIALRWAVAEMEKRYRILARAGVKHLRGYNARTLPPEPVLDDDGLPIPDTLPVLVVIVDELADLMMTDARKDVETSIARIAQKGRAAGIHIVIATQRPSREIVTGVIRANLPTKIAFMVGKRVDSQVILDQNGAETLLGKGDMLYLPPGSAGLERIQGAMVDDNDIKKVVEFVSAQAPQQFNSQVMAEGEADEGGADGAEDDEDMDAEDLRDIAPLVRKYLRPGDGDNVRKALEIIIMERKASTSYLQRRLGIGYNKAAELIDLFEARGIVGPPLPGGSKREILIFDEIEG